MITNDSWRWYKYQWVKAFSPEQIKGINKQIEDTHLNEEHKRGLPDFKKGVSPVQDWNCSYCPYLDHCNPPNKKRR